MNRIFKHYHFAFQAKTGANRISFSSYPGYLESLDDFYMMDAGQCIKSSHCDVTEYGASNHNLIADKMSYLNIVMTAVVLWKVLGWCKPATVL